MPFALETVKFSNGERFAHLIDLVSNLPHFDSTAYNLIYLRGRALATNSIEQALRGIMIFLLFTESKKISVSERLQAGRLFEIGEFDTLIWLCRLPMKDVRTLAQLSNGNPPTK